jgi:hypothetical protein
MFNINQFVNTNKNTRYERQLSRLQNYKLHTACIEKAVKDAINNLEESNTRSFVIYGEPQSGKTEMMIALAAKLLDKGFQTVVVLLNDNVQLLNQNLDLFKRSGLDPTPKNFTEILDPSIQIGTNEWVIFCKKNARDLHKLIAKLGKTNKLVVIDDEGDYATPNARINKGERTRINKLVFDLLGKAGIYIGVTATPARLDLNNTFENNNERWVDFPPHPLYIGQETFFPLESLDLDNLRFKLNLLPDQGDDPKYLREALFRFFVNVAYLNTQVNHTDKNYSILIHASGKKADHTKDYKVVIKTFNTLSAQGTPAFESYLKRIWDIAGEQYPSNEDSITRYVASNINRNTIVVMNSDIDKRVVEFTSATSPSAPFTVAIGGNIVSRGVTFDNLLSMFFTRDVKNRIQQDTYIQRARMFGSRDKYLRFFELSIPGHLYYDWHKCFIFHNLALSAIRNGKGSPVWLEDSRVAAIASGSIDRTTVDMDKGEMGFELFQYSPEIDNIINSDTNSFNKIHELAGKLGEDKLPQYLIDYMANFSPKGDESLAIHPSRDISGYKDADQDRIERRKSFIGKSDMELTRYPDAVHHIKIYYNSKNQARVFYKYVGNIRFLKNLQRFSHD